MQSFGPNGRKKGNVVLENLCRTWSLRCWGLFLSWQPAIHILFAAPAVTSVKRCFGRSF